MIAIVNPKSGNITSMCDALDRLGRAYKVLNEPVLSGIEQIVLPGQGRFGAVMNYFTEHGWDTALKEWIAADKPLFGICVGMQVLFESSDEDPDVPGLGIFKGRVRKLNYPKRPMMGWARVHWKQEGYPQGEAYYVNSFGVGPHDEAIATTTYGESFTAAVARGNTRAVQFHPEKSGAWGKELLDLCLIT